MVLASKGDRDAGSELFTGCAPALYRAALRVLGTREDAEDAVQNGLLANWRNLKRFEGRSQFSTWLTRIVISEALQEIRRKRAHAITWTHADEVNTEFVNFLGKGAAKQTTSGLRK